MRNAAMTLGGLAMVACGGTAIIDPDGGAGGAAGTTATTSAMGSTTASTNATSGGSGGGTMGCGALTDELTAAIAAAAECNACIDGPNPCTYLSGVQLTDACGCPQPVNGMNQAAVAEATALYTEWVDLGCGPFECGTPCAVSNNPTCQAGAAGCLGVCAP